jgi:hypothetical protein
VVAWYIVEVDNRRVRQPFLVAVAKVHCCWEGILLEPPEEDIPGGTQQVAEDILVGEAAEDIHRDWGIPWEVVAEAFHTY